jgi:hypothetical protein
MASTGELESLSQIIERCEDMHLKLFREHL